MPSILVTNDDGVQSPGIHALAAALRTLGDVTIVAPVSESSAIGHALTLARPLRLERLERADVDGAVFSVDGTPTDCVNIALTMVLERKPDLVVSGINRGYNLGDDITYSGTVAGAMEGALLGIPGIAVSLERTSTNFDFTPAARAAATIASSVLARGLPPRTFLNINVPSLVIHGFRATVQAKRNHVTKVTQSIDPRGRPYYWIEEGESEWHADEHSDYHAVKTGWISVTPLHPDLTRRDALKVIEGLPLPASVGVD
jgi:5'-nucleotidase